MNVKNLVLGVGIFIVFMFLLHNGIRAFYPAPEYQNYCNNQQYYYPGTYPVKPIDPGVTCTINPTPQQQDQCISDGGNLIAGTYDSQGCPLTYTCDFCSKEFTDATKAYNKIVFIIALIVGIITLIVGYAILSVEPVGSALMASGIGAIVYGTLNNWENLGNLGRFLLLLFALVLLIWIAMRINSQHKRKKGFWNRVGLTKKR